MSFTLWYEYLIDVFVGMSNRQEGHLDGLEDAVKNKLSKVGEDVTKGHVHRCNMSTLSSRKNIMLNFLEYFVNRISTTKVPKIFDEILEIGKYSYDDTLNKMFWNYTCNGLEDAVEDQLPKVGKEVTRAHVTRSNMLN